jgi:hypothetical protein
MANRGPIHIYHTIGQSLIVIASLLLGATSVYLIFSEVTSEDFEKARLEAKTREDRSLEIAKVMTSVVYSFKELSLLDKMKEMGGWALALFFLIMAVLVSFGIIAYPPTKEGDPFFITRVGFLIQMYFGAVFMAGITSVIRVKRVHKFQKAYMELQREMKL